MYFYENHMGGVFVSERELSYDELYCDTCCDSDRLLFVADNRETAYKLLIEDFGKKQTNEILDNAFGEVISKQYKKDEITINKEINNIKELNNIKNTMIVLSKNKKNFKVEHIGELSKKDYDRLYSLNKQLLIVYNDNATYKYENCKTNSHGVNKNIKTNILDDEIMRSIGFTDYSKKNWYFNRLITFPASYKGFEISFSITIPKNGDDIRIDVLDEDFCQPYDYQCMLEKNKDFEPAKIVYNQVEFWMDYLKHKEIISGHNRGDYI